MLGRHQDGAYAEGSQLLSDGDDDIDLRKTPIKPKQRFALLDSDEEGGASSKKKLLNESDFEMNEKGYTNIPLSSGLMMQQNHKINHHEDLYGDGADMSIASMDTIDAFVGPVKEEFDDLKRRIEEKDRQLEKLESDFYKKVSSKSVELEGIGPDQEAEIERHRHLFEMQQLMELNSRMGKIEREKIQLLKKE